MQTLSHCMAASGDHILLLQEVAYLLRAGLALRFGRTHHSGTRSRTHLWRAPKKNAANSLRPTQGFPNPPLRASAPNPPKPDFTSICFLGAWMQAEQMAPSCRIFTGPIAPRDAQLSIVKSFADLIDLITTSWVAHMVYIVGLGRLVVDARAWRRAKGRPSDLPPNDIVHHKPRALEAKANIAFTQTLKNSEGQLYKAFRYVSKVEGSKWNVQIDDSARRGCIIFASVGEVKSWILDQRVCRNFRSSLGWSESGSVIVA